MSTRDDSKDEGYAYVNYNKKDAHRYKGFFGANLRRKTKGGKVYESTYSAKDDLKAPSRKQALEEFKAMYNDDPTKVGSQLGTYTKNDWHTTTLRSEKYYQNKYSNLTPEQLETEGYDIFKRAVGDKRLTLGSDYFKRLETKGYSITQDLCDSDRFGKEPAIIFDRQKSLEYNGSSEVTKDEIKKIWKQEGTRYRHDY